MNKKTDYFSDVAAQHGMPCQHCFLVAPRLRQARGNPPVSSSMGTTHVCMAILLFDIRHPRLQLHQAFNCRIPASPDTAD